MTQIQSHPEERWTASGCALYKRVRQSFTQKLAAAKAAEEFAAEPLILAEEV
jgi:hypothetical protein